MVGRVTAKAKELYFHMEDYEVLTESAELWHHSIEFGNI